MFTAALPDVRLRYAPDGGGAIAPIEMPWRRLRLLPASIPNTNCCSGNKKAIALQGLRTLMEHSTRIIYGLGKIKRKIDTGVVGPTGYLANRLLESSIAKPYTSVGNAVTHCLAIQRRSLLIRHRFLQENAESNCPATAVVCQHTSSCKNLIRRGRIAPIR